MVELRPYQQDLLTQVQDALDSDAKARVMMQLPTGGGRTIIAGHCWPIGSMELERLGLRKPQHLYC